MRSTERAGRTLRPEPLRLGSRRGGRRTPRRSRQGAEPQDRRVHHLGRSTRSVTPTTSMPRTSPELAAGQEAAPAAECSGRSSGKPQPPLSRPLGSLARAGPGPVPRGTRPGHRPRGDGAAARHPLSIGSLDARTASSWPTSRHYRPRDADEDAWLARLAAHLADHDHALSTHRARHRSDEEDEPRSRAAAMAAGGPGASSARSISRAVSCGSSPASEST